MVKFELEEEPQTRFSILGILLLLPALLYWLAYGLWNWGQIWFLKFYLDLFNSLAKAGVLIGLFLLPLLALWIGVRDFNKVHVSKALSLFVIGLSFLLLALAIIMIFAGHIG